MAACLLVAAGCTAGQAEKADEPAGSDRYTFELTLDPAAPKVGERFAVQVQVAHVQTGAPVDAQVEVDATMPGHGHGMQTVPVTTALAPGLWRSEGFRFHMPGRWRFEVRAVVEGQEAIFHLPWDQAP